MASVAGIGFTMALFVGKLSLPEAMQGEIRLGILCGSILSAIWGAIVFQAEDFLNKHKIFITFLLKNFSMFICLKYLQIIHTISVAVAR